MPTPPGANGEHARVIQTLLREWAYAKPTLHRPALMPELTAAPHGKTEQPAW